MNNYLVMVALGAHSTHILHEVTTALLTYGCNIINSRMTALGNEFGLIALISGNWGTIAKLEANLSNLEKQLGITAIIKRTRAPTHDLKTMAYVVQIVTIDRPGILNELSHFFAEHGIAIEDVSARTYHTHTGTCMVSMTLNIHLSVHVHIPTLREQFMQYCDGLNLDAGMEPLRD